MKKLLLLIILATAINASSQKIYVGLGRLCTGECSGKIAVYELLPATNVGIYAKLIDENSMNTYVGDMTEGFLDIERHEWAIGVSMLVVDRFTLYAGGGEYHESELWNVDGTKMYMAKDKVTSAELGFSYNVVQREKLNIAIDYSFNSSSKFNTMILIGYKLR